MGNPKGGEREDSWEANRLCESSMARPYSTDLRERVVEAINEGATRLEAAERFGVSVSQRCDGIRHGGRLGHLRPDPAGGAARRWTITPKRFLRWWRSKTTGRWTKSLWRCASTGYPEAAHRCFVFWSVTALRTKKVLHASEQEREDVARARRRWIREQGLFDSTHLVFIDETSVNTNMTRAYGRGLEGERVIGRVPSQPGRH